MATCKQECSCAYFGLGGTASHLFATPQAKWLGLPYTFVVYRLAIAIYQITFIILTLVFWGQEPLYRTVDSKAKWLIFVSNWTYASVSAYFLIAAITALYWSVKARSGIDSEDKDRRPHGGDLELSANNLTSNGNNVHDEPCLLERPSTPWFFKVQRYFQVWSCSASVFVTLLYWILDYDPATDTVHVFTVHVHGVAALLMIIDTMLVATPFRILHMIYVMITAFVYFCFTAIYHAAGGRNPQGQTHIYSGFLDWGGAPGTSVIVGAITVFVAAPIIHLLFYALYRIRLSFGRCCSSCKHPNTSPIF